MRRTVVREIVTIILGAITVAIMMLIFYAIAPLPKKYESTKSFFFEELKRQTDLLGIEGIDDVETVRLGIAEMKDSKGLVSADLERLLAEYKVVLGRLLTDSKVEISEEERVRQIKFVDKLITEIRAKKPFSVLPETARSLAIDLRSNIESGEKILAVNQLDRLTVSLGERIKVLSGESEKSRLWSIASVFLGVVAVTITILGFLISGQRRANRLIRSLYQRFVERREEGSTGKQPDK